MKPYASAGKRLGSKVMDQSLETFILLALEARPFGGKRNRSESPFRTSWPLVGSITPVRYEASLLAALLAAARS
jgi:hypothetical protein